MKTTSVVVLLFTLAVLTNGFLYSQSNRTGATYVVLVAPQASLTRVGVDALAAGGATVGEWGLATSAITNPATMRFQQMTAYAELGKYSTSKWIADIDYNGQYLAPSYVSFGLPLGEVNVSAGYFRQLSHRLTLENIQITDLAHPDGTGEFFNYELKTDVHSFFGAVSIPVDEVASVGLSAGINYLRFEDKFSNLKASANKIGAVFILGAVVTPIENLSIGTSVRYNSPIKFAPEFEGGQLIRQDIDPGNGNNGYIRGNQETFSANLQLPPIIEVGAAWQVIPQLKVLASAEFQNWTSSSEEGARNVWNIHAGTVIDATAFLSLRLGFFTLNNARESNEDFIDQSFLTWGIQLKSDPIVFSFGMTDSHLFKKSAQRTMYTLFGEPFYQTYFSTGISVSL